MNKVSQLTLDMEVPNPDPLRVEPIVIGTHTLTPSRAFSTYWRFAAERQAIFFRRLADELPLTSDPILSVYKFTNAYRASDRVSQFLLRKVIYSGDQSIEEQFFRIILFKLFNKIETWNLLSRNFGEVAYRSYDYHRYDEVLTDALARKEKIYSAAYIMPSGSGAVDGKKHRAHLRLLEHMMATGLPGKISKSKTMCEGFELLRSYPMIGDFLAYQFITDINYSPITNYTEMEFVVAGPGARDGVRKCFPTADAKQTEKIIRFVAETQDEQFRLQNLSFDTLWGRRLQLIDCQNLFCEVDKYCRKAHPEISGVSGRTRIKQQFRPKREPLKLFYPPKWNINNSIPRQLRSGRS